MSAACFRPFRFAACLACVWCFSAMATGESLLQEYPLDGSVRTTYWTGLSSANGGWANNGGRPYADNPWTMTGTLAVANPGYGAGLGLYSWTGPYSITVTQETAEFDIQQAVFQLDVVWDPTSSFPARGGPKLNYNGGNQQLEPMPMLVNGSNEIDNDLEVPEMEGIDSFIYRGVIWQWDLSQVEEDIHRVSIVMPFANHTSVVGARIDVASEFTEVQVGEEFSPLDLWRETHFQTTENAGNSADLADPDGDGLVNLMEYALGSNPLAPLEEDGSPAAPALVLREDRFALSFQLSATPPGELTYRVVASEDLHAWKTIAEKSGTQDWVWKGSGESRIEVVSSTEKQTVAIGDELPAASSGRRFLRLEVIR